MNYLGVFRRDLFKNHCVLVTGGGSGIGRMIALELSALGADVALIGRDEDKLSLVQKEIIELGGNAVIASADIREPDQVKVAIEKILAKFPVIHALVNNAGGQYFAPLEKITPKGFDAVVKTNLYGCFFMMQEVFHKSMQKNGGAIVNIIANVDTGLPMMAHSGAARAAVDNLTKTSAFEWAKYNIRVNALAPGYIDSSGLEKYSAEAKTWIPKLKNYVPLKRMGTEAEIASSVCFLLSPAAQYITGETLKVDGGTSLCGSPFPIEEPLLEFAKFFSFSSKE